MVSGQVSSTMLESRGLHIHSRTRSGLQFILDLVGASHPCGGHPEEVSPRVGASGIADAHLPLHLGGHTLPIVG